MGFELKDSIYFPTKKIKSRIRVISFFFAFIGAIIPFGFDVARSASKSEVFDNFFVFPIVVILLVVVITVQSNKIEANRASQARESLIRLRELVGDSSHAPLEVKILPAVLIDKIAFYLNGGIQRNVIDESGKIYKVFIKRLPDANEAAYLYCVNPESNVINLKQKYAIVLRLKPDVSSAKMVV